MNNKVSFFIQALFGVQSYDKEMKERAGDGLFLLLSRRECLVGLVGLVGTGKVWDVPRRMSQAFAFEATVK